MSSVALFLIAVAGIFLLGAVGEAVFRRTNVPDVVWLIGAGLVLGPIGGVVSRAQLTVIAPYFAALTLVVVLFEGGSRLNLSELTQAAPRSGVLAVLTFLVAVAVVAVVSLIASGIGWLAAPWSWQHGVLLGSILGGSSSIIIMPAMAQARVEPKLGNLVNLESAFTDAFCVVGASAMMDLILASAAPEGTAAVSPGAALARSLGIGSAIGLVAGALWLVVLKPIRRTEHAYPITLSALLLLYVAIDKLGGSAALGILSFAVIVGNAGTIGKRFSFVGPVELRSDVRGFHSQMTFIIKSFFFTFIGAMLGPPWSLIALGVLLGLVLLLTRVPGTWVATVRGGFTARQKQLVVVAMPRGMAAGVLATMPAAAGVPGTESLPTVVFACVLTSIIIFAIGFPLLRRSASSVEPAAELAPGVTDAAAAPVASATAAEVAPPAEPPPPAAG